MTQRPPTVWLNSNLLIVVKKLGQGQGRGQRTVHPDNDVIGRTTNDGLILQPTSATHDPTALGFNKSPLHQRIPTAQRPQCDSGRLHI